MKGRTGYFVIAVLLTILNAAVGAYCDAAIWKAWSGDIWGRGLLVLLAALGTTSPANVWVQAVFVSGASVGSRSIEYERSATPIPAEARGDGDV